jgi:ankyrin repeat protein
MLNTHLDALSPDATLHEKSSYDLQDIRFKQADEIWEYLNKKTHLSEAKICDEIPVSEIYGTSKWVFDPTKAYEWAVENNDKPLLAMLISSDFEYEGSDNEVEDAITKMKKATKELSNNHAFTFTSMNQWQEERFPVHDAICKKNTELLKLLIAAGADLTQKLLGNSLLATACEEGNIEACEILINEGLSLTEQNAHGMTPLAVLVQTLEYEEKESALASEICSFLKAQNQRKDFLGHTLLHHAILNNQVKIAEILIENGALVYIAEEAPIDQLGRPLLNLAIMHGMPINILELLATPETVNQPDREGYLPLHYAINYGLMLASQYQEPTHALCIIAALLNKGADPKKVVDIVDPRKFKHAQLPKNGTSPHIYLQKQRSLPIHNDQKSEFLNEAIKLVKCALWEKKDFSKEELNIYNWIKTNSEITDKDDFVEFLWGTPYKWAITENKKHLILMLIDADIPYLDLDYDDNVIKVVEQVKRWSKKNFTENEEAICEELNKAGYLAGWNPFAFFMNDPYKVAVELCQPNIIKMLLEAEVINTNQNSEILQMINEVNSEVGLSTSP